MKRSIPLVGLLLIIAAGSWAVYTQPAKTNPTPKTPITQAVHTPSLLLDAEAQDVKDQQKVVKLTPPQIAKIRKKSGQTEVRGMVKIRQDAFPVTFVAGMDTSVSPNPVCQAPPIPEGYWTVGKDGSVDNVASTDTPAGWSVSPGGVISGPASPIPGVYRAEYIGGDCGDDGASKLNYFYTFTVTGDLTGSVNVTGQTYTTTTNTATIALKADTATGLEVVSAVVDWGDGSSTETITPNSQHYSGSATHTYTAEGDYTISVTYTDNASPTPNTITVTTTVHVCFPTSTEVTDFIAKWGGATVSPLLKLIQTSSTFDSGTGLYTNCYKVGIWVVDKFATEANRDVWFPDASWILPDIATTSDDLTDNVGPINFCISSTTNNESQSLSQITCSTYIDVGMCGMAIGLPLDRFTVGSITTFRRGSGGGFWGMLHR